MKTNYHAKGLLIGLLLLALFVSCAAPETLSPEPTATPVSPTHTSIPPTATPNFLTEAANLPTEVTRGIVYTNIDERATSLDVYAPSQPGPWPVVVVVHGAFQSRSSLATLTKAIASQGAVVYNIDVTHGSPHLTSSLERIACGVRFAKATAADYGGDPSWITLVGHSAGAHDGAVIALAGDDFAEDCDVTDESAVVDAFVAYEGPYDWTTTVYHSSFDYTSLKNEDPELGHAIDPYSHIGLNHDLEVRLVHGDDEDVAWYDVPLEVSMEFHQALADAGYDVELIVVEDANHGALISGSNVIAITVEQVMELADSSSP